MSDARRLAITLVLLTFACAVGYGQDPGQPDVEQPAVLVTGASSGIGLKITELLAADGVLVYAGARRPEDLARLDRMENVRAVRLDVTVQSDINAAVARIAEEGRGLHGVVNNAGVASIGPLIEIEAADVEFVFDVNVLGPFRITKAFAPMLIESNGRVVNIGSISGVLSASLFGVYSMSKHAIEAYTDSLSRELDRFGVHVAAVEPGNYSSDIGRNMLERMQARGFRIEDSRYAEDLQRMLEGFSDYDVPGEFNPEPDDVALAVRDALFSDTPKDHYMVVPYERQAEITIRKIIEELVRYNEDQKYTFDRDTLVRMLDEELARGRSGNAQ
jgi:NAD(P)-dependent dehydrogenase (short-subunit alcohol dehydrogenase family)